MLNDLRLAIRILARSSGSTAIAISTLAIAIGANTAIFSVLNAALLKSLPVRDPAELVMLTDPNASMVLGGMLAGERSLLGYEEFTYLRDHSHTLAGICASQISLDTWPVRIAAGAQEQARGRLVSENYFDVFGVRPAIGRLFAQSDAAGISEHPYAVISYDYWQRRFGGAHSAVGTTLRLHAATLTIIGVAAPGFRGETVGQNPDIWVPMLMQALVSPGWDGLHDFIGHSQDKLMWLHVFGRRKAAVTIPQIQAEVDVLFRQILQAGYPDSIGAAARKRALNQRIRVRPVRSGAFHGRDEFAQQWIVLAGLAGLVLLIASANIANLLLIRAVRRAREVAVRFSLGARRGQLMRQFLMESLVLAASGGVAGIFAAAVACRALPQLLAHGGDRFELAPEIDLHVLAFTACTVLLVGLLFGLAPAFRATHAGIHEALKGSGRAITDSRRHAGFSKALVITQVTVSFLLVLGAGVFLQTLWNLQAVPIGYPRQNLLLMDIDTSGAVQQGVRLDHELAERIGQTPGVRAVAYSDRPLFNGFDGAFGVTVEGFARSNEEDRGSTGGFVGPGYFSTLGIPILLGREIGPRDSSTSPRVCVINEAFAKRFFAGRSAIGKYVTVNSAPMEVIGIAKETRGNSLRGPIEPKFYASADQNSGAFSFEIRTAGDPGHIVNAIRRAVLSVDENLAVSDAQSLAAKIDQQNAQPKLIAELCIAFGGTALFLAAIGIYGVLSYNVERRANEIGIRIALGGTTRQIAGRVVGETGSMVTAGLIAGIAGAAAAARLLAAQLGGTEAPGPRWSLARYEHVDTAVQLYGVRVLDLPAIAGAIGILVAIAFIAAWLPAVRATRVEPASVLRHE